MKDLINTINRKYVHISNRVTRHYERKFAVPCDLYFPIFNPYSEAEKYNNMKIFSPHQSASYNKKPDKTNVNFYIVNLIKNTNLNSAETEISSAYPDDEASERPYIETSKKRELPIQTKVVVKQGQSTSKFFVDKKLVVTGADGFMLLRMYLSPLMKDNDEDLPEALEQEEFVETEEDDESVGLTMNIPDEDE